MQLLYCTLQHNYPDREKGPKRAYFGLFLELDVMLDVMCRAGPVDKGLWLLGKGRRRKRERAIMGAFWGA
jgi:hypothetical protein